MPKNSYIIMEAGSVKEAVKKALKALNATEDQVITEILAEGRQGLLGIFSQPAKVKVSLKQDAKAEAELADILIDLDIKEKENAPEDEPDETDSVLGLAKVKEGRLIIKDPAGEEKYALIKPGKNVKLIINGNETADETPVTEKDEIQVEVVNEEPLSEFELKLSNDKLEANLRLMQRKGATYKLKDQPPANRLIISAELDEIIEPPVRSPADVMLFLQEHNIIDGVIEEAVQEVLANPNSKKFYPVAEGRRPVHGTDAYIHCLFNEKHEEDEEEGLFGRSRLISVLPEEAFAVRVPKEAGMPGRTVTGEDIPEKPPADCEVIIKSGCRFSEDGEKIIADIAGRPVIETKGNKSTISVEPVIEIKEVNQDTGDIKFAGSVIVTTNVCEGFRVEADGSIEVRGDVTGAELRAAKSVTVYKMVLGSTISAGGRPALYSAVMPLLKEIRETLAKLHGAAAQVKGAPGLVNPELLSRGDGPIIQALVDAKFRNLVRAVKDLACIVNDPAQFGDEEVMDAANLLQSKLCGLGPMHLTGLDHLVTLRTLAERLIEKAEEAVSEVESVKVRYVQNSTLVSSGDVIVEGQGAYISSITAGGEVIVTGTPGVARGVKIAASGNVTVKELGSDFDTNTFVHITGDGRLNSELVHPNVIVQIGIEKYRADKGYRNFAAYLDGKGRLFIEKLLAGSG